MSKFVITIASVNSPSIVTSISENVLNCFGFFSVVVAALFLAAVVLAVVSTTTLLK